jgi:hypothetical protein
MAKNLGRKYPAELAFDEPRIEERMGQHYASPKEEIADPEHRDGLSAQLDDEQHQRAVHKAATRGKCVEDPETIKARIDDV